VVRVEVVLFNWNWQFGRVGQDK